MFNIKNRKKGVTVIELLMVVSILSVLTSVVLVTVDNTREKAKLSAIKTNTKTIFNEGAIYYSDNNGFTTSSSLDNCESVGGVFGTTKIAESLNRISDMSTVDLGSSDFYCYIEPNNWSFALDISSSVLKRNLP